MTLISTGSLKLLARRYLFSLQLFHWWQLLTSAIYRREHRNLLGRVVSWRRETRDVLVCPLSDGRKGTALIFGWSQFEYVLSETVIRKGFELAGFRVRVLTDPTPAVRFIYSAFGCEQVEAFLRYCPLPNRGRAAKLLSAAASFADVVALEWCGVAIGKYASSSLMRQTRKGALDLDDPGLRRRIIEGLAASMAFVEGANKMIDSLEPGAVILVDRGYSPYGEVFDVCVNRSVPVYTWNVAHRDNTLMLKRYYPENRDAHPSSLSLESWAKLSAMPWGEQMRASLRQELAESYSSGEWYGEVGTQFGKKVWTQEQIVERLGLDRSRKTAIVFAHIFWDATFFWGEDLFRDYEDWFVQTVRAACANDRLNWLIKVHPANLVKDLRDGVTTEPSELMALRERIGKLPEHVKVIPADTDINTLSLLEAIDYCLTVRGTVGMEAALLGRTVLTAGTGRYDRHGFTVDSASIEEYLTRLESLETLPPPTESMRELAEKYAYGIFICRPLRLNCFNLSFAKDATASLVAGCSARTAEELAAAPEIVKIGEWLSSNEKDYLDCPEV
jgi:hypothetical protein